MDRCTINTVSVSFIVDLKLIIKYFATVFINKNPSLFCLCARLLVSDETDRAAMHFRLCCFTSSHAAR